MSHRYTVKITKKELVFISSIFFLVFRQFYGTRFFDLLVFFHNTGKDFYKSGAPLLLSTLEPG